MKPVIFLSLIICFSSRSQTTLYFTNADGTIDKNSYRYVIHSSGLVITHDKITSFKNDTAYNFVLLVDSNKINCEFIKVKTHSGKRLDHLQGNLGYLTADKKIIECGAKVNHHETRPSYIKDSKIYSFDNKILAFIDGEEIYGAALYLLND
jgi:hypothetical protein